MTGREWQVHPTSLKDDGALVEAILEVHRGLYQSHFADDPLTAHHLPIEVRAFRRQDGWRFCLLLTPWMMVRLCFPDGDPAISVSELPGNHVVLGPRCRVPLLGTEQEAHLGHHPRLGHYLLQPLVLSLEGYASADAVFDAWDDVIRVRDENLAKARRECPMQRDISRHELLGCIFRRRERNT